MTVLEIFEKVNLIIPLEQRRFFNYFDDTVKELQAMYGGFVVEKGSEYTPPESVTGECAVLPLYGSAIADNIIWLANGDESRKAEFMRKAKDAYLKYWNDNAKGRVMKRWGW